MSGKCVLSGATLLALLVCALVAFDVVDARPSADYSRSKRFSEQKILDIEAKLAYSKMKGKPVISNFGGIDEARVGRIRRSSIESNLRELRRILRSFASEDREYNAKDRRRIAAEFARQWRKNRAEEVDEAASGNRLAYDGLGF